MARSSIQKGNLYPGRKRARTVRRSHSAGGVAYRRQGQGTGVTAGIEVALIATADGTRWQLPKGRLEAGETPVEAAVREVREETGLETVSEGFLKRVEYTYTDTYRRVVPELVLKRVEFFLLRVVGGRLSDASIEVYGVGWWSPAEALAYLTYSGEQDCLRLALEKWK